MYLLLYAPRGKDSNYYDWAIYDEFSFVSEACATMSKEVQADIENEESYAYRIIKAPF